MILIYLLLFLAAVGGNTAIWVWIINRLYGTRHRGWWVTLIRLTCQALVVLGPPTFIALWWLDARAEGGWATTPWGLIAYVIVCVTLGLTVVPYVTVARWLRRTPSAQIANHTEIVDVAAALGHKPRGPCKHERLAYYPFNQIFEVEFAERTFQIPRLPRALDGLSILQVSDTHLCGCPTLPFYEWVFERCAANPVDIVAVTGDVLDSEEHYHWIMPLFSRLRGREANWAILGNHDSWLDVQRINRRMERCGYTMLGGRWREVRVRDVPIVVIGNEMPWLAPTPDLADCPDDRFRLCLSHSPDTIYWARANKIDLVLAGHNHGGQIRFPLIGPLLVPSRYSRKYDAGTFQVGGTLLHVSRGLGGTYPLRYNCRPEVTRIVLRSHT
jgi:predicted MPP superfamily phosphohydrolase